VAHVLLPVFVLVRRADTVEAVRAAVAARAGGAGVCAAGAVGEPTGGWGRAEPLSCGVGGA